MGISFWEAKRSFIFYLWLSADFVLPVFPPEESFGLLKKKDRESRASFFFMYRCEQIAPKESQLL